MGYAILPSGIVSIGTDAFGNCARDFMVIVPAGSHAEAYCRAHDLPCDTPAVLPAALLTIQTSAFDGSRFSAVTLSENCVVIESQAFANCPNLRVVDLKAGNASIAPDAFPDHSVVFYVPAGSETYNLLIDSGYVVYARND